MTAEPRVTYARDEAAGRITEDSLNRMRARIGVEVPKDPFWQTFNIETTADAIRHFTFGYGDDNPLYCDPRYARKTRWRSLIAPPVYLHATGYSEARDVPPEKRAAGAGALRGVHAFWSGNQVEWYRPIYPGDRIIEKRAVYDLEEKTSEFGGKSIVQRDRMVFLNQRGELVAIWYLIQVRAERGAARERGRNRNIERHRYTPAEIAAIDELYAGEEIRGAEPRYWEDVAAGEKLGPIVKGPFLISDVIAWYQGSGRWEILPGKLRYKNRLKHPAFYTLNSFGVPDAVMRCHWEDEMAQQSGNPMAYDFGVLRHAWLCHLITNWMGDDAWLWKMDNRIRRFNYIGDTTWIRGEVVGKSVDGDGNHLVEIDVQGVNQREEVNASGRATVLLPSRAAGPVQLPRPPAGLEGNPPLADTWEF
jgi:acyl dehydratase